MCVYKHFSYDRRIQVGCQFDKLFNSSIFYFTLLLRSARSPDETDIRNGSFICPCVGSLNILFSKDTQVFEEIIENYQSPKTVVELSQPLLENETKNATDIIVSICV
jgi:hypothetical protein